MEGWREFQILIDACGKERRMMLFDRGGRVRPKLKVVCAGYLRLLLCIRMLCDVLVGAVAAADMASEVHTSACTADRDR